LIRLVNQSEDPLYAAAILAAMGSGVENGCEGLKETAPRLEHRIKQGFARSDYKQFQKEIPDVASLLYLASGAAELVYDRIFIETLKALHPNVGVMVAVSRHPLFCEALREDALLAGIEQHADLIDKGYDGAGTLLAQAGDEFQIAFSTSDIIISKGQAHFQTLQNRPDIIYFMLQAKCQAVARSLEVSEGDLVFVRSY